MVDRPECLWQGGGLARAHCWVQERDPIGGTPGAGLTEWGGPNHDPKLGRVRTHGPDEASNGAKGRTPPLLQAEVLLVRSLVILTLPPHPIALLSDPTESGLLGGGTPKGK